MRVVEGLSVTGVPDLPLSSCCLVGGRHSPRYFADVVVVKIVVVAGVDVCLSWRQWVGCWRYETD